MKRSSLVLTLCAALSVTPAHAADTVAPLSSTLKALQGARRQVIATLPAVVSEEVVKALKAAATRGTTLFLITNTRTLRQGGYLLTLSHAPGTVHTYLTDGAIPVPWIMVDGAWVASGAALDGGTGDVTVSRDRAVLGRLNTWATSVTRAGPVPRVELLKRRYAKS